MPIEDKNKFESINKLKIQSENLIKSSTDIFNASDSTIFIETYIIELIDFFNKRYSEYGNIEFKNIKHYIPYIKIKKNFIFNISPLSIREVSAIIKLKNENLAILLEKTDLSKKIELPLNILDENALNNSEYLKEPLEDALNLSQIKSLITYSKSLFVIPSDIEFISIYFGKLKSIFENYFNVIQINPLQNKPLLFVGEDKEISRTGEMLYPDKIMNIDNLAQFHKETQKRNIDILVKEYNYVYEFINNSDNYLQIRNVLYNFAIENFNNLCE